MMPSLPNLQFPRRMHLLPALALLLAGGCEMLPQPVHQPQVFNPFPQIHKVAVAPFFNLTTEPWVDGRQFALAYYHELQAVPGYEVVPIGVVERTIQQHRLQLSRPEDARRLAQLLEVDAVVVGAVTDFSPYYPPRCGLVVEWYAANECFQPILPGYGLPWDTPEAEHIPQRLRYEAAFAQARLELNRLTPQGRRLPPPETLPAPQPESAGNSSRPGTSPPMPLPAPEPPAGPSGGEQPPVPRQTTLPGALAPASAVSVAEGECTGPQCRRHTTTAACLPSTEPVLKHVAVYQGNDPRVVEALKNYYALRKDARFGDWMGYLQRSDDFIRFCCRLHIYEMLTARGGAGKTQVVWQWPQDR